MNNLPPEAAGVRPAHGPRSLPPVRPSSAPIELTLDLRATPPDKVLSRLLGALERISADVTLYVLLRDTPEYVGVAASAYQALRSRGYFSDSSRMPQGGQRLRVQRRREAPRLVFQAPTEEETTYAPAPEPEQPDQARSERPLNGEGTVLPGERLSRWGVAARNVSATGAAGAADATSEPAGRPALSSDEAGGASDSATEREP
jgi:hypothetical protein